jgi:hypothetical protein
MIAPEHLKPITLPLEPVIELFADADIGWEHIAAMCGCGRRALITWRTSGVPIHRAEDMSDSLGLHPSAIWGMEYYFACDAEFLRKREYDRTKTANLRKKKKSETT